MTTEAAATAGEAGRQGPQDKRDRLHLERGHARCIVVGTSREGPIKGVLLGSTAYKLLHVSDRPVVVVPR